MNLNTFNNCITNNNLLNSETANELQNIIEHYPYFQTARLLYLKNLQNLNDFRFNDELKITSVYALNREILYNIINSENINSIEFTQNIDNKINVSENKEKIETTVTTDKTYENLEVKTKNESVTSEEKEIIALHENFIIPEENAKVIDINTASEIKPDITELNSSEFNKTGKIEVVAYNEPEKIIITENNEPEKVNEFSDVVLKNDSVISEEKETIALHENIIIPEKNDEIIDINTTPETKSVISESNSTETNKIDKEVVTHIESGKIITSENTKPEIKREPTELKSNEEVKESIADQILKKVAEIKSGIKNPYKLTSTENNNEHISVFENIESRKKPEIVEQPEIQIAETINNTENKKELLQTEIKQEKIEIFDTEKILNLEIFKNDITENNNIEIETAYDVSELLKTNNDKEIELDINKSKMSFSDWLTYVNDNSKKQNNKKNQDELIEKFIKEKPKIDLENNILSINSEIENKNNSETNTSLVSETLADIYYKQGYFEKSIETFEKLALKYPEKSIYFANRISEIKLKINNQ